MSHVPQNSMNENDGEIADLVFSVLIEEYKIANQRILRELESDEKQFEFTLLAISATVAATSFALNNNAYFSLLMFS